MTTIKLAVCAALFAVTIAAPADASSRRSKPARQQVKQLQIEWIPLFLGVSY